MNRLGFHARCKAILHKLFHPTHKILWRTGMDEMCSGDITCETCQRIYWCRFYDLSKAKRTNCLQNILKEKNQ